MHRYTDPTPGIVVGSGIGFHCRSPLVCTAGALNSQRYMSDVPDPVVLPYIQRILHQPYFYKIMRDHTWHAMFKSTSLPIRLNCSLACLFSRSIANRKRVVHAFTTSPAVHPRCYTRLTLTICRSRMDFCAPRIHPKPL
ncbi:hypothetical protein TNCV_2225141 [Trichonephila clavipes]|nr:hypothetical protein TNCV_2225141 [Trichonephila clavipes]